MKREITSNFSSIRSQMVSTCISLLCSFLAICTYSDQKNKQLKWHLKQILLRKKKKTPLSSLERNLSRSKSILFGNLEKEVRNIWGQWRGSNEFQKGTNWKLCSGIYICRQRLLNHRRLSSGVVIWTFQSYLSCLAR